MLNVSMILLLRPKYSFLALSILFACSFTSILAQQLPKEIDVNDRIDFLETELAREIKFDWLSSGNKRRPGRYVNFGITYDDKAQYIKELGEIADEAQIAGDKLILDRVKSITKKTIEMYPSSIINESIAENLLGILRDRDLTRYYFNNSSDLTILVKSAFPKFNTETQTDIVNFIITDHHLKYLEQQRHIKYSLPHLLRHIGNKNHKLSKESVNHILISLENQILTERDTSFLLGKAYIQYILPNFPYHTNWKKWLNNLVISDNHNENILELLTRDMPTHFPMDRKETASILIKMLPRIDYFVTEELLVKVIEKHLGTIESENLTKVLLESFYMHTKNYNVKQDILKLYSRNSNGTYPFSILRRLKAAQLKMQLRIKCNLLFLQ